MVGEEMMKHSEEEGRREVTTKDTVQCKEIISHVFGVQLQPHHSRLPHLRGDRLATYLAISVIQRSLLLIRQRLICLVNLFNPLFALLLSGWVFIRMKLESQFSVSSFDLRESGFRLHTEERIQPAGGRRRGESQRRV